MKSIFIHTPKFSFVSVSSLSAHIHPNARWQQNGLTVAGGNRQGNGINQLSNPWGLYVDDDQTIYAADWLNHRIVEWKWGATSGQVVAGGNGQGSGAHQLYSPLDVIVDKERDSLIICDRSNRRVVRWPRRNGTSGETIISNIDCVGLTMDENGSLYVTDDRKHEVRRYRRGESQGTVVAGGNGSGNRLDQLSYPQYVFVDRDHSVYVSEYGNDRVMKWVEGAKQGIVVAGGQGKGNGLTQLYSPQGVVVDQLGTVYVADPGNDRIMRWPKGATQGSVIVGGNGRGGQSNQLNQPIVHPLRGSSIDIHPNARWQQNGLTVAGGNQEGNGINQLHYPCGLYVDDDQTIYVTDGWNHRIVEWKWGATSGQVVAGGNGQGSGAHQLSYPYDVIVDKERESLIICDYSKRRVVRWPRRNGTSGETIISNIDCWGLTMDENGSLYVIDIGKHEVRRYQRGESQGTVVAGGNGSGNRLDQLSRPHYVFVDRDHSVYVSDWENDRVMKWVEGAKQGIVVAGGQGQGNGLTQLYYPQGVVVDQLGTVYVADEGNNRIMRWPKGATQGSVIVGGNGQGEQSNQLNWPI
ncbi:unnamed protein product, partial [Rotaria sp. Silwood2]